MRTSLCLKASSFSYPSDICIPDDIAPMPSQTGWRAVTGSRTCVLDGDGHKTGYVHVATLEEYNLTTGNATGNSKPNTISDANYIADYQDTTLCVPYTQPTAINLQVGMQDGGNSKFSYVAVLGQALSVPVTINFNAQYKQNNVNKAASPLGITIPAGRTSITVVGDAYDNTQGALTEFHTQITGATPANPDGKTLTFLPYDGNNQSGALN